jgi:hypothetical protein
MKNQYSPTPGSGCSANASLLKRVVVAGAVSLTVAVVSGCISVHTQKDVPAPPPTVVVQPTNP